METKEIILLTAGFPYGNQETFLETEIEFLAQEFEKVYVIAIDPPKSQSRVIPRNCIVSSLYTKGGIGSKLWALKGIFNHNVIAELKFIRKKYNLTFNRGILATILISYQRALQIEKRIEIYTKDFSNRVLYSYWCDDSAIAVTLLKVKNPKLKGISRVHGWDLYFEASYYNYLPFRNLICDNMNLICPISNFGYDYIQKQWKVKSNRNVQVHRLGVKEQELLAPDEFPFRIISCSNVIPIKRVELIVRALSLIKEIEIEWTHFGDGPELKNVKQLAKEILPNSVTARFLGRIPNHEVLNWYKQNKPHLFINVSLSEGIPVSIMEAMSFGVPVIATDVGGTAEIVNNENGILLSVNESVESVANNISCYFNGTKQKKTRENAYQTWMSSYNANKNYRRFIECLKTL